MPQLDLAHFGLKGLITNQLTGMPAVLDVNRTLPALDRLQATGDELRTDVAGVEIAGDGGVGRSFDDGAAVGEQCDYVRFGPEFEHEIIVAHCAVNMQSLGHLRKIYGPVTLVDLHRIATA